MIHRHHKFMLNFTKTLMSSFRRPVLLYLVTLSASLIIFCSFLFYYFEAGVNPNIRTFFDAIYFSVTIMTGVGLGDISPVGFTGRLLSMAMMLIGTGIYVSFTAVFAAIILEAELNHRINISDKDFSK